MSQHGGVFAKEHPVSRRATIRGALGQRRERREGQLGAVLRLTDGHLPAGPHRLPHHGAGQLRLAHPRLTDQGQARFIARQPRLGSLQAAPAAHHRWREEVAGGHPLHTQQRPGHDVRVPEALDGVFAQERLDKLSVGLVDEWWQRRGVVQVACVDLDE